MHDDFLSGKKVIKICMILCVFLSTGVTYIKMFAGALLKVLTLQIIFFFVPFFVSCFLYINQYILVIKKKGIDMILIQYLVFVN